MQAAAGAAPWQPAAAQAEPDDLCWDDMHESKRIAAATLGYSRDLWDQNIRPEKLSPDWSRLGRKQLEAAVVLGYSATKWLAEFGGIEAVASASAGGDKAVAQLSDALAAASIPGRPGVPRIDMAVEEQERLRQQHLQRVAQQTQPKPSQRPAKQEPKGQGGSGGGAGDDGDDLEEVDADGKKKKRRSRGGKKHKKKKKREAAAAEAADSDDGQAAPGRGNGGGNGGGAASKSGGGGGSQKQGGGANAQNAVLNAMRPLPEPIRHRVTTNSVVRVRSTPTMDGDNVLGKRRKGDELTVLAEGGGWVRVRVHGIKTGFMLSKDLSRAPDGGRGPGAAAGGGNGGGGDMKAAPKAEEAPKPKPQVVLRGPR